MKWRLRNEAVPEDSNQLLDILLENRNIDDDKNFFKPIHPSKITPESVDIDVTHLSKAVARIQQAQQNQEKVLIYGDYDADGITATGVLWQTLHAYGCKVMPFIPDRQKHGYGLSDKGLDDILGSGRPDLIITVDNGIVAFDPLTRAQEARVEVIITDHHMPEKNEDGSVKLPPSLAVVHSTKLCGATVSWMLANAVTEAIDDTELKQKVATVVENALDLCGIGTIADQVPLRDANRSFAFHGTKALQKTKRPGILALLESGKQSQDQVNTFTINYVLAPRINAMGRLAHGLDALRLLCTSSKEKARELAVTLNETNVERQDLTSDLLDLAIQQTERQLKNSDTELRIIVVASEAFHEGVVGLVAGRLVEMYHRPAIALSLNEDFGKASARSVPGVNIIELIRQVKDDLLEAGGHPMAAGFGVALDKVERVKKRLEALALEQITDDQLQAVIDIDCVLPYELASKKTVTKLDKLAPFGKANPRPFFAFNNYQLLEVATMGREDKHLRLKVVPADDSSVQPLGAVWWGGGEKLDELLQAQLDQQPINLAGRLNINHWKNRSYLQVVVEDTRI
jgi:single-stranded-DNA-specific exonuclease